MMWTLLSVLDLLLFAVCALSALHLLLLSVFCSRGGEAWPDTRAKRPTRFLLLLIARSDDGDAERTVRAALQQQYDRKDYDLILVGIGLPPLTDMRLAQYPITYLKADVPLPHEASALQYANARMSPLKLYDLVVTLRPGDTPGVSFLGKLDKAFRAGCRAMQTRRVAADRSAPAAALAATLEEVDNSLFRAAHNNLGLPSALAASGSCLEYGWFRDHVGRLGAGCAVKQMEALLLRERVFVDYMDDIPLRVDYPRTLRALAASRAGWGRERRRAARRHARQLLPALLRGNRALAGKALQWALPSKVTLSLLALAMSLLAPLVYWTAAIKWWALSLVLLLAYALATPDCVVDKGWPRAMRRAPLLALLTLLPRKGRGAKGGAR